MPSADIRFSMLGSIRNIFAKNKSHDREKYSLTLAQCFELANDEIYTRSHGYLKNRAYSFYSVEDRLPRLARLLKELAGIDSYSYVGSGDNAIIVQYDDNQLIRLRAPAIAGQANTQKVPVAPMICPIWKEVYFEKARLNFVPFIPSLSTFISSGKISRMTAKNYVYELMRGCFMNDPQIWFYDYKNFDFKFEQIGIIPTSVPIILDLGSVIYSEDIAEADIEKLAQDRRFINELAPAQFDSWDGKWINDSGLSHLDALICPPPKILALPDALA